MLKRQFYIPACGDRFKLTESWTFSCYFEHRNTNFLELNGVKVPISWRDREDVDGSLKAAQITLPAGTELEMDRLYVRQTSKMGGRFDYDSLTFKVVVDGKAKMKQRFWAKLSDCNQIVFEPTTSYKDRQQP